MNLHKNQQLFQDIINEISFEKKISTGIIEKDYYVTYFLKELLVIDKNFIFKGGTSLSKGFKIIERFSEDIDLNYPIELLTVGVRKKIKREIISIIKKLGCVLINEEEIRSRRTFNQYKIDYNSLYKGKCLKPIVIVETAFQTESYPVEKVSIQSLVGEFLKEKGLDDFIRKYDLSSFSVNVQSKERTLVDKIFAIGDYYLSSNLEEHSRHIYDIYQLINHVDLNNSLASLFMSVKNARRINDFCFSAKDDIVLSKLLEGIIESRCFELDYNTNTVALCYNKIDYETAIESLKIIVNFLKQNKM